MPHPVVEDCTRINAHALWLASAAARENITSFAHVAFEIRRGELVEAVDVELLPCRFGGSRAYFRCPSPECARRATDLYSNGDVFRCRVCMGLAYRSQQLRPAARIMQRRDKIAAPLRVQNWFAFPEPRPPGMHQRTYDRLVAKAGEAHYRGMAAWWGALAYRRVVKAL